MATLSLLKSKDTNKSWRWLRPEIDLRSLPATADLSMSKIYVIVLFAVGGFWTLFSWGLVTGVGSANWLALAFTLLFPAIGMVIILCAVLGFVQRREVTFDKTGVTVNERKITGRANWSLLYSDFEGVLYRERVMRGKNSTVVYQIIELYHKDPDKIIPLYVKATPDVPRKVWEDYARTLNLPALSESAGQVMARRPDELDKSIRDLVKEGRLKSEYDPSMPAPKGLEMSGDKVDGATTITIDIDTPRYPVWMSGLFYGFPLLVMLIGFSTSGGTYLVLFSFAFALLVSLVFVPDWATDRQIEINQKYITFTDELPRNVPQSQTLQLEKIEEIKIARPRSNIGHEILVIGDQEQIAVGAGLSKEALGWLRDLLISAIANAEPDEVKPVSGPELVERHAHPGRPSSSMS